MVALSGNPAVDRYVGLTESESLRKECVVKAATSPLQCPITGLSRGTRYQTSVRACLPGSAVCGEAKVLPASTRPQVRFFCEYSKLTTEILLTCFFNSRFGSIVLLTQISLFFPQYICFSFLFHLIQHICSRNNKTFAIIKTDCFFIYANTIRGKYPVPVSRQFKSTNLPIYLLNYIRRGIPQPLPAGSHKESSIKKICVYVYIHV